MGLEIEMADIPECTHAATPADSNFHIFAPIRPLCCSHLSHSIVFMKYAKKRIHEWYTVKQDIFTAIKFCEFNISDLYKAIKIHVVLFVSCILISKK